MNLIQDYEMFSALWRYYKQFSDVRNCDDYWDEVIATSSEIHEKYPNELCKGILVEIIDEFDRRSKNNPTDCERHADT